MSLETAGYRAWSERLQPTWFACWTIARTGLALVLRRKIFWVLLALAAVNFLFVFALIYLKAQIIAEAPEMERFVNRILRSTTGSGETYRDFMFAQGTVTVLLLAFAGETLVGADYRQGGLRFYLSRRIGRMHYWFGKLLTIGLLVSFTTTIPALILYVEYGLLSDSLDYFRENLRILFGIVAYGMILATVLSLLLFALASWLQKTVPLVMAWAGLFFFVPALGLLLRQIYGERNWMLLILWRDMRLLGSSCFGAVRSEDEAMVPWALLIVLVVCAISAASALPRLRAVQVVN